MVDKKAVANKGPQAAGGSVDKTRAQLPADPGSFEEHQRQGFEEAKRDDYAVPFISILQSLSPQVDENNPEYINGAKPGMLLNTVTKQLNESIVVIPCRYTHTYCEWVPRDKGGGFRGEFPAREREEAFNKLRDQATGRAVLPNGNELTDARNFYVLVEDETSGAVEPAVISMGSTQIKKARQWMTIMNTKTMPGREGLFVPAMFASRFRLTTKQEQNKKGKWHGWLIEWMGFFENSQSPGYQKAISFSKMVDSGKVSVDRMATDSPGIEGEESDTL